MPGFAARLSPPREERRGRPRPADADTLCSVEGSASHTVASDRSARDELPTYRTLLRPVLEAIAANEAVEIPAITSAVADRLGLSEAARQVRLPNGRTVLDNRVRWA